MAEQLTVILLGAAISTILALMGLVLTLIWAEIRRLRDRVHALEGALATLAGSMRARGIIA